MKDYSHLNEHKIPEEKMMEFKQLEAQVTTAQKDLQLAQSQFELANQLRNVAILQYFLEHGIPKATMIRSDGTLTLPEEVINKEAK